MESEDGTSRNTSILQETAKLSQTLDSTIPEILKKYDKLQKQRKQNLLSGIGKVVAKRQVFQLSDSESDTEEETAGNFKKPSSVPSAQVKKPIAVEPAPASKRPSTVNKADPVPVLSSLAGPENPNKSRRRSERRVTFETVNQDKAKSTAVQTWLDNQEDDIHESPTIIFPANHRQLDVAAGSPSPSDFLRKAARAEELVAVVDESSPAKQQDPGADKKASAAKRLSGRMPRRTSGRLSRAPEDTEGKQDKMEKENNLRQAKLTDSNMSIKRSREPADEQQTQQATEKNKEELVRSGRPSARKSNPGSAAMEIHKPTTLTQDGAPVEASGSVLPAKARQGTPMRPVRKIIRTRGASLKRDAITKPVGENQPASSGDDEPSAISRVNETAGIKSDPQETAPVEGPMKAGTPLVEDEPNRRSSIWTRATAEDVTATSKPAAENHPNHESRLSTTRATALNTTRKHRTSRFRSTSMFSKGKASWRESVKLLTKPTLLEYSPGDQALYDELVQVDSDGEEIPIPKRKISVTPNPSPAPKSAAPTKATFAPDESMDAAEQPPPDSPEPAQDSESASEELEDVPVAVVQISSRAGSRAGTPMSLASVTRNRPSLLKRRSQNISISDQLFPAVRSSLAATPSSAASMVNAEQVTPRLGSAQKRKSGSLMSDTPVLSTEKVKRRISRSMMTDSSAQESDGSSLDQNGNESGKQAKSLETRTLDRSRRNNTISVFDDNAEDLIEADVEILGTVSNDPAAINEQDREPGLEMRSQTVADMEAEESAPANEEPVLTAEKESDFVERDLLAGNTSVVESSVVEPLQRAGGEPAAQLSNPGVTRSTGPPESTSSRRRLADQKLELFRQSFIALQRQMEEVKNHLFDYLDSVKPE